MSRSWDCCLGPSVFPPSSKEVWKAELVVEFMLERWDIDGKARHLVVREMYLAEDGNLVSRMDFRRVDI